MKRNISDLLDQYPAEDLDYQVASSAQPDSAGLGMVELTIGSVCGEDDGSPPGR